MTFFDILFRSITKGINWHYEAESPNNHRCASITSLITGTSNSYNNTTAPIEMRASMPPAWANAFTHLPAGFAL